MKKIILFEDLVGCIFTNIEGCKKGSEEIIFTLDDGRKFQLFHDDECCETVFIEDIDNDPKVLLNSEVLLAEVIMGKGLQSLDGEDESFTWVFYKLITINGGITIRWYGESNGNYSEEAKFMELIDDDNERTNNDAL